MDGIAARPHILLLIHAIVFSQNHSYFTSWQPRLRMYSNFYLLELIRTSV